MKKNILLCLFSIIIFAAFAQLSENVGIGVRLQIDSSRGYKITGVVDIVPNGAAQAAGLQAGDIITKVDGQSTRDVVLKDVVGMIAGKEGTEVKLVIERKGATRNYTITRQKYKYAGSFYENAAKDNSFCMALAKLMNDAAYNFENVIDTLHYHDKDRRRLYECKLTIPGAEKVSIMSSFGYTAMLDFGSFETKEEINAAGTPLISQIKTCFPEYYYEPAMEEDGSMSVLIGKKFTDGYEGSILRMGYYLEEPSKMYKLYMYIPAGKRTRFRTLSATAGSSSFGRALRTIYNDIPNNYRNVRGAKHEEKSTGLFSTTTSWFDIKPVPDGARDCFMQDGVNLSLGNGCNCRFFLGENPDTAAAAFLKVFNAMEAALAPDFVYTFDKSDLDMTIPADAKTVATFGIKKRKDYESAPLISLVLVKYPDKRYAVNMLFHKFGF